MGAYLSEVFRAAILSIDEGQREAGISIGMSKPMIYSRVILPQAMRIAIPTVGGYFISLLKDFLPRLLHRRQRAAAPRHDPHQQHLPSMRSTVMVAIIYFAMSFVAARLSWPLSGP